MDDDSSSANRSELWWSLRKLAYDAGVQRKESDLVELLRDKFSILQQCWKIDLDQDAKYVRSAIIANVQAHIERLNAPTRLEQGRYVHAVMLSFNMLSGKPYAEPINKDLTGRRKWLWENADRSISIAERTSARYLDNAVSQIEKQILAPGYEPIRIDSPAVVSPAERRKTSQRSDTAGLTQSTRRSRNLLAGLIELSGEVERVLEAASNACEARRRALYTFDVLLALLDIPTGRARDCFDEVAPGLSTRVRQGLLAMPEPGEPVHPFIMRKWGEFPWMASATDYALQDDELIVTDMHVLLAILDGQSGTNRWLRRYIPQEHPQVRMVAERKRHEGPTTIYSPTPR